MINNISQISFQGSKKEENQNKRNVKGGLSAICASTLVQNATAIPVSLVAQQGLSKYSKTLTKDEVEIANKATKNVLENLTNLSEKGVKFVSAEYFNIPNMPKWLLDQIPNNLAANGKNAFFNFANNEIIINQEKLPLEAFHEMGHAFNFNNTKIWKTMQTSRQLGKTLAGFAILLPAITKDTKAQDGKELTKKEKFVNTLRKVCPFIAGAAMLPTVLEEGMATFRGNAWAKEVFKDAPELAKKVAKTNRWGFVSYLLTAGAVMLSAFVAKKVKDNSDEKLSFKSNSTKQIKLEMNAHQG